jgi:hypothetical protein
MKISRRTADGETSFLVADLPASLADAVRGLYFTEIPDGWAKTWPTDTRGLDSVYRNFERFAPDMILQAANAQQVPWDKALEAFLSIVGDEPIDWWLAGSAALSVRGMSIEPRDLDIITDGPGAARLGELFADHLVEPVLCHDGWIARWWGRAFLHARIEWVGEVLPDVDGGEPTDFGPYAAARLETVTWHGHALRLPPLDLQLAVTRRRGLADRVALIERFLAAE